MVPLRLSIQEGDITMLLKSTLKMVLLLVIGIATIAVGLMHAVPVAGQDDADTQAKIDEALSAGPAALVANATILDYEMDDAGNFVVLREGSNDWTCFPNDPRTPGMDPMCVDQTWMGWVQAYVAGEDPDTQTVGLAYMLRGGSDASNIDPFAAGPEEGNEWITSPAHVMVIMPGDIDQNIFSTDPLSGGPWIMYAGTPYEHVMMPVDAHTMVEMGEMGEMGGMAPATPSP
jgi:hypothetical protein